MPIYTYACEKGHETDALQPISIFHINCASCGGLAVRRSVYAVNFTGGPTRSAKVPRDERPYSLKEFSEASAEMEYAHGRAEERIGRKLAEPPLFKAATRKAATLIAAGVKDSTEVLK